MGGRGLPRLPTSDLVAAEEYPGSTFRIINILGKPPNQLYKYNFSQVHVFFFFLTETSATGSFVFDKALVSFYNYDNKIMLL